MTNLATMPGLERNLRILIDWTLDVPFRADIAVLAPDVTSKLQKLHLETGDEIIRQGEEGDTAYIIQTGRVEIIKSGKKVGELARMFHKPSRESGQGARGTANVGI